jgi:hypothetical protein
VGDTPYEKEDGMLVQYWYQALEAEIFFLDYLQIVRKYCLKKNLKPHLAYHFTMGVGKLKEEIIEKLMPGIKDIRRVWDQPVSWKKSKGLI